MLKRLMLAFLCGVFFFACTGPVISAGRNVNIKDIENKKEFVIAVDDLLVRYETATDKDKIDIKKDIAELVANFFDKEIQNKRGKIAKLQAAISEYEADKSKAIKEEVDSLTSDKGRKQNHKKKSSIDDRIAKQNSKKARKQNSK